MDNLELNNPQSDMDNLNNSQSDLIKHYQDRITIHLQELDKLVKECDHDASEATKYKRKTRLGYFVLGIFLALFGALTTSLTALKSLPSPEASKERSSTLDVAVIVIGAASTLAGAGVATLSKDFDYAKFRERAIKLKDVRNDIQISHENFYLNFLKLQYEKSSFENYEALLTSIQDKKKELIDETSKLGVGV